MTALRPSHYMCVCVSVLRLCCSMAPSRRRTRMDLWASEITAPTLSSSWYSAPSLLTRENNTRSPLCVKRQWALLLWWCLQPSLLSRVATVQHNWVSLMCLPAVMLAHCLFIRSDIFIRSLITLLIPSPFEGSNPQSSGPKHGGSPWSQGTVSKCN